MSRITGVVVALATAAAVLTGSTVSAEPAPAEPPAAQLPREIPGGVELTLADGDRLRVWAAENYRAVFSRRLDAATGAWGSRVEVLRRKNLFCGEVEGRTANGAVALLAQCDEGGYYEDTAPVSSQALWSPDGVTWSSYELDGEGYEEPGISPDGSNAVWPLHQAYVTRTEAGFVPHRLTADGQEYTVTATITDAEQVSYLYGTCAGGRSRVVVQTRIGDAVPTRQEVRAPYACGDVGFANVDSDTVWLGDLRAPAQREVVSRADGSSPWALTRIAPAEAPGLEQGGRLGVDFFTAPDIPLLALGSAKGHRVRAQRYDPATQTWGPSTLAYDAGRQRCRWGDNWIDGDLGVIAVDLKCDGRHVVLTTRDGVAWQALRMGTHVRGLSADGRYVAVPGRRGTSIISSELGVVTLPLAVTGRCDVVVPDGPDGAVLLTARGRHGGWPTVLQHSTPTGWSTLSRTSLPTFAPDCVTARSSNYELPYRFDLYSRWKGYTVRVVERGGTWTVRRSAY